ncbi:MAG: GPMC system MBL fold metallohydrolase [Desulfuromonadaceae bacterium]|nr:GPMC system MBL fold metallohydrolase [Desulfuromonadaceae bacterium]
MEGDKRIIAKGTAVYTETKLKITILGCGTSTGVPVLGCACSVCTSEDPRNQRTRSSLMLMWNNRVVLVDTGPDLRAQCLREKVKRVDGVIYTHTHADHVHGIDDLRPFNAITGAEIGIYGARDTVSRLEHTFAYAFKWNDVDGFCPRLQSNIIDDAFDLFGLRIVPVELKHGHGTVLGYRFGGLAYLTDCSDIPAAAAAKLLNLEVLIIDGLRFRPHVSHLTVDAAIEIGRELGAKRIILTHLSHDVDYTHHSQYLPPGVELAYDGMHLSLKVALEDVSTAQR